MTSGFVFPPSVFRQIRNAHIDLLGSKLRWCKVPCPSPRILLLIMIIIRHPYNWERREKLFNMRHDCSSSLICQHIAVWIKVHCTWVFSIEAGELQNRNEKSKNAEAVIRFELYTVGSDWFNLIIDMHLDRKAMKNNEKHFRPQASRQLTLSNLHVFDREHPVNSE